LCIGYNSGTVLDYLFIFQVLTKLNPRPAVKTEVDWWVILLSILGGITFIALLVLILYKVSGNSIPIVGVIIITTSTCRISNGIYLY